MQHSLCFFLLLDTFLVCLLFHLSEAHLFTFACQMNQNVCIYKVLWIYYSASGRIQSRRLIFHTVLQHRDQSTLFEDLMSAHFSTLPPGGLLPNCIFRPPFVRRVCLPSSSLLYVAHSIHVQQQPHVFLSLFSRSRAITWGVLFSCTLRVSVEKAHAH